MRFMQHEQVELPELGFTVDRGLEELIRACWRRGIRTSACCIGTLFPGEEPWRDGPLGYIGFYYAEDALRWSEVTGRGCEWINDEEVATDAEYYFDVAEIPDLLAVLAYP